MELLDCCYILSRRPRTFAEQYQDATAEEEGEFDEDEEGDDMM